MWHFVPNNNKNNEAGVEWILIVWAFSHFSDGGPALLKFDTEAECEAAGLAIQNSGIWGNPRYAKFDCVNLKDWMRQE